MSLTLSSCSDPGGAIPPEPEQPELPVVPEQPETPDNNEDNDGDNNNDNNNNDNNNGDNNEDSNEENNKMKITIGSTTFNVSLASNPTAAAFKRLLPLTINMSELNNNEKYYDLPQPLPTSTSNPGTIQNGDLMLYGSGTLVLFYKTFSTPYSYTRIGRVDNPTGLQSALGAGSVIVTFE